MPDGAAPGALGDLFHGSPVPGMTRLEPSHCVVDPADLAGADAQGYTMLQPVVWLTSDRTAAVVFALKHLAEDLVLDARHHVV